MRRDISGFTLIELLIVVAILGILAAAVLLILNPVQLLAESRDGQRFSDIDVLSKSITLYQTEKGGAPPGNPNTVYVSVADSSSTCGDLGLPSLPSGWSYACSSNPKASNGTGWIPVNFNSLPTNSLSSLPIDPVNSTSSGFYYTYNISGNQYEVTGLLESQKFRSQQEVRYPIPNYPGVIAEGSSLYISPLFNSLAVVGYWNFDQTSGTTLNDSSGNGYNGTWEGTLGSQWTGGKVGNEAGNFDGTDNYVAMSTPYDGLGPGSESISAWAYPITSSGYILNNQKGGWVGWIVDTGAFIYSSENGSNDTGCSFEAGVLLNQWNYITVVVDRTAELYDCYVNGVLENSGAITQPGINTSLNMYVGARGDVPDTFYQGQVDDVRLYDTALSAAEVRELYNAQK